MNHAADYREIEIELEHLSLRALRRDGPGPKILAVHGWLDNAASFIPLIERLDASFVSLDLPGNGHSQWIGEGQRYHLADMAQIIQQTAAQLGWDDFTLMGHSLGGALSMMAAVSMPEAVKQLIMLDSSGPLSADLGDFIEAFRKAQAQSKTPSPLRRVYSSIDDAVQARLRVTKMDEANARLIVERNLEPNGSGWQWGSDPRWRQQTPIYLQESQVLALLRAVQCPTLWVIASDGYVKQTDPSNRRAESIADLTTVEIQGYHHAHMDNAHDCAAAVRTWLDSLTH